MDISEQIENELLADYATIGVIGLGNMGRAAVKGLLDSGIADQYRILVSNGVLAQTEPKIGELYHENLFLGEDNESVAAASDVIFLSLKQQTLQDELLSWNEQAISLDGKLLVSFAAGISIPTISYWLDNPDVAIARVMPNTPTASGRGVLGWYLNDKATKGQERILKTILASMGLEKQVEMEEDIDLITAISGSGPAYFYRVAEAMTGFAVDNGFSEEDARLLVYETMIGAAHHVLMTGEDVSALRKKITSKGGTTEAAMMSFAQNDIDRVIAEAMQAAYSKAQEIGRAYDAK